METNPLDIIKKVVSDTNAINAHIANGGKLNELKGIKFAIPESMESLRDLSCQTDGLQFWNNSNEDIYQDYL